MRCLPICEADLPAPKRLESRFGDCVISPSRALSTISTPLRGKQPRSRQNATAVSPRELRLVAVGISKESKRSNAPNAIGAESGLTPPPIPLGGIRRQPASDKCEREEDGDGERVEEHGATQFIFCVRRSGNERRCRSFVRTTAPRSKAHAAIQTSFVGIGLPLALQ